MSCWSYFRVGIGQGKDPNSRHVEKTSATNATTVAVSERLAAFAPSADQKQHSVQWYRAIRDRFDQLPPKTAQALLDLCDNDDLGSSMTYLEGQYQKSVGSSGIRAIESILLRIDAFERALTTFAQVGPLPVQVLWGSTQLLINPRRKRFDNLKAHGLADNMIRLLWSKLDKNFDNIKQRLQKHSQDLEDEAKLAVVQATRNWQAQIEETLSSASSGAQSSPPQVLSTLPFPRNFLFSGRNDLLQEMYNALLVCPSNEVDVLRSMALVGIGGIGKTQIALEYAYRFRGRYSGIFWVRSETEMELQQSLAALAKELGLCQGAVAEDKAVELVTSWLNSNPLIELTAHSWLLVFDNAEHVSTIRRYWPHNPRGNVIVTSQKHSFGGLATSQVTVQPLSTEEGSSLILSHMHLDDSARPQAEELSVELGGCPLAIAHYAGFCVASHLTLQEILDTFQRRMMTAEIWSCSSNASLMQYEKTLKTVWDAALASLNPSSRELLDLLAYLDPDEIPEDFIGVMRRPSLTGVEAHQSFELTSVVSNLIRRNLISRNMDAAHRGNLRLHRSLRLALMLKLDADPDRRQVVFDAAVRLTRAAFPVRDMTSRTPQNDPVWTRFMPQVVSLQTAFERSDPPMTGDMVFAGLLADAGSFLWEHQMIKVAFTLLSLGERIAEPISKTDQPSPALASIETFLGILDGLHSVERRAVGFARLQRVVKLRAMLLDALAPGTATLEQQVDLGRAWNDLALFYLDTGDFDKADELMSRSITLYTSLGDETTLRFRFAVQYNDIALVRLVQGQTDEALHLASQAYSMVKAELGSLHLLTARLESRWSHVLLAAGNVESALVKMTDVLFIRSKLQAKDNPDILTAKYWIGTMHYYLGRLEEAEMFLRDAIEFKSDSGLGEPDFARAQYRLALVLHEKGQSFDGALLEDGAVASIPESDRVTNASRGEIMTILDTRVFIHNGRSTGAFRGRREGKA
ncbi:hypothetical protein LLEC1_04744 [Akanthomyces lecanii]|uniref:NB-ARC domain-containing protein n=1 Tax=Cordyceps confragosa TaxID=2714763 RepID=A0A179ID98_CORDF|nr:hypothetical protein LLEC1_04744 [Akanthomyces lecanii]